MGLFDCIARPRRSELANGKDDILSMSCCAFVYCAYVLIKTYITLHLGHA